MNHSIKVIGFDADDTLWVNEPFFKEIEEKFCKLLNKFESNERISQRLFETETKNISFYGYGIKSFTLSMVETALEISNNEIKANTIKEILNLGKEMLQKPVKLINGVEKGLKHLKEANYMLIVVTKGDLLDQQRKLQQSGLEDYFHHIEIVSDKQTKDYAKIFKKQEIHPNEFLMIGNSLKSDVIPVIKLGGYAIHVPYEVTWKHEEVEDTSLHLDTIKYSKTDRISDAIEIILNHENTH